MHVLVAVASKHGATAEIGESIATVLRDAGRLVDVRPPDSVDRLDGYDAVVLGSSVYAGSWMSSARSFVDRFAGELVQRHLWLFSSGPIGDPPMPEGDIPEAGAIVDRLGARGHRTFAGRLDRRRLGLMERAITTAIRAPDGDFRDPDAIGGWAREIAASLVPAETRR